MNLERWIKTGVASPAKTKGEVGIQRNGNKIDLWIRHNGQMYKYSVNADELKKFVSDKKNKVEILRAESEGNAEEISEQEFALRYG